MDQFDTLSKDNVNTYFSWPIPSLKLHQIYDALLESYITTIRNHKNNIQSYDIATVISLALSIETVKVIQSTYLADSFVQKPVEPTHDKTFEMAKQFAEGHVPNLEGLTLNLMKGFHVPVWRKIGQFIKDILNKNSKMKKCLSRRRFKKSPISFILSDVAMQYNKENGNSLYFYRLQNFFLPPKSNLMLLNIDDSPLARQLMSITSNTLKKHTADGYFKLANQYMLNWLSATWTYTDFYLSSLEKRMNYLPNTIFVGTAGIVWYRLLARFLRRKNKEVVRIAHGCGSGCYASPQEQGHFELEDCTTFVTWTENHAKGYRAIFSGKSTVQSVIPNIYAIKGTDLLLRRAQYQNKRSALKGSPNIIPQKILVALPAQRGAIYNRTANESLLDVPIWEFASTLCEFLNTAGYEATLKPHPEECKEISINNIFNKLKANIMFEGNFENIYHDFDTILFLSPRSTIFSTMLLSQKKVIYLDLGCANFLPPAYDLLKKSCHIVKGHVNNRGLITIDWEALQEALSSSPFEDSPFSSYYYYDNVCPGLNI